MHIMGSLGCGIPCSINPMCMQGRFQQHGHTCLKPVHLGPKSSRRQPRQLVHSASSDSQADTKTDPVPRVENELKDLPIKLNTIPHSRAIREHFYAEACQAVLAAIRAQKRRLVIRCAIPETNPQMDVYRIGTVLEMVRELAYELAVDGVKVKVCVQQALGVGVFQGMPLSLSGVMRIMRAMDWGEVVDFVTFGNVRASEVDEAQYYIVIAPQNVVGSTIMSELEEMVEAAESAGKTVILVNPILKDIPSAAGVMGVRGRKERMALEGSFLTAYHFRLLYLSSQMMYPIMGAMRYVFGKKWQVFKRVDLPEKTEAYQLLGEFASEPDTGKVTELFTNARQSAVKRSSWW